MLFSFRPKGIVGEPKDKFKGITILFLWILRPHFCWFRPSLWEGAKVILQKVSPTLKLCLVLPVWTQEKVSTSGKSSWNYEYVNSRTNEPDTRCLYYLYSQTVQTNVSCFINVKHFKRMSHCKTFLPVMVTHIMSGVRHTVHVGGYWLQGCTGMFAVNHDEMTPWNVKNMDPSLCVFSVSMNA